MRKQSEGGSSFIIPNTEDKKKINEWSVGHLLTVVKFGCCSFCF
jgi:hypothetical protein